MKKSRIAFIIALALASLAAMLFWRFAPYSFRMARLIYDHAVLQRDAPIPIWGWGKPGCNVWLKLENVRTGETESYQTQVDETGNWKIQIKPHPAGGPYQMYVVGQLNYFRRKDLVFGDVWLCAGQSNMSIKIKDSDGFAEAMAAPLDDNIRYFRVNTKASQVPLKDYENGRWNPDDPSKRREFSALPYYFAKQLQQHLQVPIGVVNASLGSSRIEAWMPSNCFEGPFLRQALDTSQYGSENEMVTEMPTGLFNHMVAPSIPYPIKGIIWWQGESDTEGDGPLFYKDQFACLIERWREARGDSLLPFLFVQLANIGPKPANKKVVSDWPRLREAQLFVSQRLSRTAMVTSFDISHPTDIHPGNKKGIAERLVLAARSVAYGEQVAWSGPVFQKMEAGNGYLALSFETRSGLVGKPKDAPLQGFKVAGEDRVFHAAEAKIEGNTVILRSSQVPKPVAARYAWERSPVGSNLYNEAGLPTSPFRTDGW